MKAAWNKKPLTNDKRTRSELSRLASEFTKRGQKHHKKTSSKALSIVHPLLSDTKIQELESIEEALDEWSGSSTFRYRDVISKAEEVVSSRPWYLIDPEVSLISSLLDDDEANILAFYTCLQCLRSL